MASEKHDESFRVVDRRLFNAEGELRQDVVEQERREEERQVRNNQKAPVNSSAPGSQTPAQAPAAETLPPSRSFQMLVDLLARNAALFLGGYTDPASGRPILDLDGAREVIDMLEVLREKTRGNLAAEDDRFLVEVLGSLKLSFLEVSKAAAQAMREGAPAGGPMNSRSKT